MFENIRNATTMLRRLMLMGNELLSLRSLMFTARSRWGRSIKIFLFTVGMVMPLGSLIWALLLWHGSAIRARVLA